MNLAPTFDILIFGQLFEFGSAESKRQTYTFNVPKENNNHYKNKGVKLSAWLPPHLKTYLNDRALRENNGNVTKTLIKILTKEKNQDKFYKNK